MISTRAVYFMLAMGATLLGMPPARASDAERLPALPAAPAFPSRPQKGELAGLAHVRLNVDGPAAEARVLDILDERLVQVFSPDRFHPELPRGAKLTQPMTVSGSGTDVEFGLSATLKPQGCPLGLGNLIPIKAHLLGRTQVTGPTEGVTVLFGAEGGIACENHVRIYLDLAGSDSEVTANAAAYVVDACLRAASGDGSLALDLYSSLVVGDGWGTLCAGANVRGLLRLQTQPIAQAIESLLDDGPKS